MQIQSKSIEDSQNIQDIKRARNANECVVVLSRINTAFSLLQTRFTKQKLSTTTVAEGIKALGFCADSLIELRCARAVSQEFNDKKRERCFQMIDAQTQNIREFQKLLIDRIDKACSPKIDKHLGYLSSAVYKLLSKISEVTQLHVIVPDTQMVCFRTKFGVTDSNGYISGPITVKLVKRNGSYFVSLPDTPFVESQQFVVDGQQDVQLFLKENLADYEYVGRPTPASDTILSWPVVQDVVLHSDKLDIILKPFATPADINKILIQVLPHLRRAVELGSSEVIHRVSQYGPNKTITLLLAKRKVYDVKSLNRLAKVLQINKSKLAQVVL